MPVDFRSAAHNDDANRVLDAIVSELRSEPALSTKIVVTEFRRRAPESTLNTDRLLELLILKAATWDKAIRFDERAP